LIVVVRDPALAGLRNRDEKVVGGIGYDLWDFAEMNRAGDVDVKRLRR
jgi:hypothetical protein